MSTVPTASYLVCGTPRGGTSLLCGLLAGTGLAGRPEEYFWRDDQPDWSRRWGVAGSGFAAYLRAAIAHGTTGPAGDRRPGRLAVLVPGVGARPATR